jgi:hypothetical protein
VRRVCRNAGEPHRSHLEEPEQAGHTERGRGDRHRRDSSLIVLIIFYTILPVFFVEIHY